MGRITSTVSGTENSEYSGDQISSSDSSGTSTEYPPLGELLHEHLAGCTSCQDSLRMPPVFLGQKGNQCSEYWEILDKWRKREGEVNNIVAHDEYGNQAPTVLDPSKDGTRWRLG